MRAGRYGARSSSMLSQTSYPCRAWYPTGVIREFGGDRVVVASWGGGGGGGEVRTISLSVVVGVYCVGGAILWCGRLRIGLRYFTTLPYYPFARWQIIGYDHAYLCFRVHYRKEGPFQNAGPIVQDAAWMVVLQACRPILNPRPPLFLCGFGHRNYQRVSRPVRSSIRNCLIERRDPSKTQAPSFRTRPGWSCCRLADQFSTPPLFLCGYGARV